MIFGSTIFEIVSFEGQCLVTECVGLAKKRGARKTFVWELFFALIFLRIAARLLFVSRQKVRELEAQYINYPH